MVVRRYRLILCHKIPHINSLGSSVARFAGLNVHKRLVTEETYKNDDYEVALKNAFLGTDEDLLASRFIFHHLFVIILLNQMHLQTLRIQEILRVVRPLQRYSHMIIKSMSYVYPLSFLYHRDCLQHVGKCRRLTVRPRG
jgi:hypothetical protein